ncbi:restriction endonuclease, partial [Spiroplasma melliferum]
KKNLDDFFWIEPSVGEGCFLDLLPKNKRLGIDICPRRADVIKSDYLQFTLPNKQKNIVIGNPPFGHRGTMALEFINHSFPAADYVCFILPMFFSSIGKGSIKYRVKNYNLIYQEELQENAFYIPNGGDVDIKCVFQIWSKNHKNNKEEISWYNTRNKREPFSDLLSVFTVSLAKNRECGKRWIYEEKADFYISSTFFKENKIVKNFENVKYKSGIAIKYNIKNKCIVKKLNELFENINWIENSSRATNSCYHIGKSHIYKILLNNGFEEFM